MERFITEEAAEPELEVETRLLTESVGEALETLDARDARVLRLYFGLEGEREPCTCDGVPLCFDEARQVTLRAA